MGNYTILKMFKNPRRDRQARDFTINVPKILDLKSSSEQIFSGQGSLARTDNHERKNMHVILKLLYTSDPSALV